MKELGKNLAEFRAMVVPTVIARYVSNITNMEAEVIRVDPNEPFDTCFGGNFYLVEQLGDLAIITTAEGGTLETGPGTFDECCRLADGYAVVLLCTNNSGGNTYFIPEECVTPHVLRSITLTKQAWSD
jgi:hypothetical protein